MRTVFVASNNVRGEKALLKMLNLFRRSAPSNCIFCEIVSAVTSGESNSSVPAEGVTAAAAATPHPPPPPRVLVETPSIIAIRDKFPAAKHHFLVIPKRHIDNAKCLTFDDLSLWEEMMGIGKELVLNEIEDESER